jgi:septal ring factor EnvC (AmiA/AmiB activator)
MKYFAYLLILCVLCVGCQNKSFSDTSAASQQQLMLNEHEAQLKAMKNQMTEMDQELNALKQRLSKQEQDLQKMKPAYIGGNVQEGGH